MTLRILPAKSMERDLRQQIIAVKWQLVEATRRASIAEATLARNGLSSFETADSTLARNSLSSNIIYAPIPDN